MRVLLTIQYLGTRYAGWQAQANATGVQNVLENALTLFFQQPLRVEGAGRTDSGVHARAQRAHLDIPDVLLDERGLVLGINTLLPRDIRVTAATPVAGAFHCRFEAKSKRYVYRIWNARVADVFADPTHTHVPGRIDVERMHAAARPLIGEHDFRSFTVITPEVSSTARIVRAIDIVREGSLIAMSVEANGFLRYMVRRIAGLLIEVGRNRLPAEAVSGALEPRFSSARWTAPARGLTLEEIVYEDVPRLPWPAPR